MRANMNVDLLGRLSLIIIKGVFWLIFGPVWSFFVVLAVCFYVVFVFVSFIVKLFYLFLKFCFAVLRFVFMVFLKAGWVGLRLFFWILKMMFVLSICKFPLFLYNVVVVIKP